jgi:hypothetical protein
MLLFSSCRKAKTCEGPNMDCKNVLCIAYWYYFDFRLIDKISGEDLVFSANPRYSNNDIKLFADAARTVPIQYTIDYAGKVLHTMTAKEEMYLEIKGTDVYKLTASFRPKDCCASTVKDLWLDGQVICSCCTGAASLSIR